MNGETDVYVTTASDINWGDWNKSRAEQSAKADGDKIRPTLVPTSLLKAVAVIREYGTHKYGSPENWKQVSVERYRDALARHVIAYIEDPNGVDKESGYPHLWHVACNVAFLLEKEDLPEIDITKKMEFK